MVGQSFTEHFLELKSRLLKILVLYLLFFCVSFYYSAALYEIAAGPLIKVIGSKTKFIYTGLAEAFFTYLTLSAKLALLEVMPFAIFHLYKFMAPGLYKDEKILLLALSLAAPVLFILGIYFVYNFVMPKAFEFFLHYEYSSNHYQINLEARVSEYISLFVSLIISFGFAFELPVIILILVSANLVSASTLGKQRRIAILLIFIIAGIITPPDVLSQLFLAFPLMALYEITIVAARAIEAKKRRKC